MAGGEQRAEVVIKPNPGAASLGGKAKKGEKVVPNAGQGGGGLRSSSCPPPGKRRTSTLKNAE